MAAVLRHVGGFPASVAQAVHMGTFAGYSSSRMEPDENITREQAIVVLARTVCLPTASPSALSWFPDRNEVGAWAADAVAAIEPQRTDHPCGDGSDYEQHFSGRL